MIFSCPIVTTDLPSVKDQIRNGENGAICLMNPENIAQAIYNLYCDEGKRKRIAN